MIKRIKSLDGLNRDGPYIALRRSKSVVTSYLTVEALSEAQENKTARLPQDLTSHGTQVVMI